MVEPRPRHISAIDGEPDLDGSKPVHDAGDIKSVKALEKEVKSEAATQNEFIRDMMLDVRGRKWFFNLLTQCHILRNPFSPDPLRMSFDCGEMNIGQQVFVNLQSACPDLYLKMMEENNG